MNQAFLYINATRIDAGPLRLVGGALQQETRLFDGEHCGSPEWEKFHAQRRLDTEPAPAALAA